MMTAPAAPVADAGKGVSGNVPPTKPEKPKRTARQPLERVHNIAAELGTSSVPTKVNPLQHTIARMLYEPVVTGADPN
jgi:hypothetical protein